jgi:uncharacterized protein YrrD
MKMTNANRIASEHIVGNPVIEVTNGKLIAKVEDLHIDPVALKAAAAITSKNRLLRREVKAIPAAQVQVWGQDAVLAKNPEVIVGEEELDGSDGWLSASDDIRGFQIVAEDGTRVGTLSDVVLDHDGQLMGYEVTDVADSSRVAAANWIDVKATRSLGPDVLIVKSEYV